MKFFSFDRLCAAALLLALLPVSTSSTARGETWPAWMTGASQSKDFDSQLSMARLNERHGRHDAAIKIYQAVLAKQPENPVAHHRLAIMAATNGDFVTADQHFGKAYKTSAKNPELLTDIGYALFLQNRLDEAEKSLRGTINQFPGHKRARNTLGMVLGLKGRYEEALAEFRQVVDEAEAHANLAFVMTQTGDLEQATRHYHEAIKRNPKLRPAAEALVQLSEQAPAASPPPVARTVTAPRRPSISTSRANASTTPVASPATANQVAANQAAANQFTARSTSTSTKANPANADTIHTPASPSVQNYAMETNAERPLVSQAANDGRQQANPIPAVAKPFAPQVPIVPTQDISSFSPAIQGLSQPDRIQAGIQATEGAHDHMIARHEERRKIASQPASQEVKPIASPASLATSTTQTSAKSGTRQDLFQSLAGEHVASAASQETSAPAAAVRAQVLNFDPVPTAQAIAQEESPLTTPVESDLVSEQAAEQQKAVVDEPPAEETPVVETVARLAPGAYALAAARAQADLLTQDASQPRDIEPNTVPTPDATPIPLPAIAELALTSQVPASVGQPIPTDISASEALSAPATYVIAPAAEPTEAIAPTAPEELKPLSAKPVSSSPAAIQRADKPTSTIAPWQIGVIAITSIVGFVMVGKTVKSLGLRRGRRRTTNSAQTALPAVSQQPQEAAEIETAAEPVFDLEQACTNLESSIREVRAGLSSKCNPRLQSKRPTA